MIVVVLVIDGSQQIVFQGRRFQGVARRRDKRDEQESISEGEEEELGLRKEVRE